MPPIFIKTLGSGPLTSVPHAAPPANVVTAAVVKLTARMRQPVCSPTSSTPASKPLVAIAMYAGLVRVAAVPTPLAAPAEPAGEPARMAER